MLTRLYIDNFKCFVNFEYRPAPLQLILGANGSGKTTLLEVISKLRAFAVVGDRKADEIFPARCLTLWELRRQQQFELDASVGGGTYRYKLVLEYVGEPAYSRVATETLSFDDKTIFEFIQGEVQLFNDRFERKVAYDLYPNKSALSTIYARKDNTRLTAFKEWLAGLYTFRVNPYAMLSLAEGEVDHPAEDLSDFASWYRHLIQDQPQRNSKLFSDLEQALDGFESLRFEKAGINDRRLLVKFRAELPASPPVILPLEFDLSELSDGQRALIVLYVILHFVVQPGATLLLDEPENFVALREIQPWFSALMDRIEDTGAQALLISHHPELINLLAPGSGVRLFRESVGPVRIEPYHGDPESSLTPAELIARGWDRA